MSPLSRKAQRLGIAFVRRAKRVVRKMWKKIEVLELNFITAYVDLGSEEFSYVLKFLRQKCTFFGVVLGR